MTVRRGRAAAKAPVRRKPRAAGKVPAPRPEFFLHHPWLREAGVTVTPETASQVAAAYGCCRLIVDSLAPTTIKARELRGGGVREDRDDDSIAWLLNYGAPVSQFPDAPSAQAIREALLWSALLLGDGNGYAEIQRDGADRPVALWPIEPGRVTPRRDETGFFYEIQQPSGGSGRLEPRNMFHLPGPSLYGWTGDATVYRGAKAIGLAHAEQVFAAAYHANGTVVSGLLTSDKVITQKQADDAKARWNEQHAGGPGKQHGVSVVGQGLKYQPLNHNAQESQLVEGRRFQVAEIARFYGVPLTLLADNEAWTNLSELFRGFATTTLKTWARRFDLEATRKLYPQRQPWREVYHDLTHLVLGSFKEQVSALSQATGNKPILTQNEARAVLGRNSMPDGDDLDAPEPKPAPKLLPAKPEPSHEEDDGEDMPMRREGTNLVRDAIATMFGDAFDRHARRLSNLKSQTRRDLTDDERTKYRARLVDECSPAVALAKRAVGRDTGLVDLAAFMDAIDAGEPTAKAAERLVAAIWETP